MPESALDKLRAGLDGLLEKYSFARAFERRPPPVSPHGYPYATFNRRMMASMIDACILTLLLLPFNHWIMQFAYRDFILDPVAVEAIMRTAPNPQAADQALLRLMLDAGLLRVFGELLQLQYTVLAAYSFLFWHWYSATPGKLLLRMRIIDEKTGGNISDWQSFLRIIGYLLSGLPLMFGFFCISWHRKKRGWHDLMAGTSVIVFTAAKSAPPVAGPSDSPAPAAGE